MIDRFEGEYSWLSNFSNHHVTIQGKTYKTVEHYYQCMKAVIDDDFEHIYHAPTPGQAKRRGRRLTFDNKRLRPDWYDINMGVMYEGLYAKFMQHDSLRKKLMATGCEDLIEGNNWGDTFWGTVDGEGKNHLGRLLKKIRRDVGETYQVFSRKTGQITPLPITVEYEGGEEWIKVSDDWFPVHTPSGVYKGFFADGEWKPVIE